MDALSERVRLQARLSDAFLGELMLLNTVLELPARAELVQLFQFHPRHLTLHANLAAVSSAERFENHLSAESILPSFGNEAATAAATDESSSLEELLAATTELAESAVDILARFG